jgi:large subunit ribosomal protein L20
MSRTPRSVPSRARRNKVLKQAKGMRGRRKNNITTANAAVDKSLQHNYIGRKERKRNFRALWIQRINAAVREHGLTYSRFIAGLAGAGIEIDRKVLSDLAIHEPTAFKALVDQATKA